MEKRKLKSMKRMPTYPTDEMPAMIVSTSTRIFGMALVSLTARRRRSIFTTMMAGPPDTKRPMTPVMAMAASEEEKWGGLEKGAGRCAVQANGPKLFQLSLKYFCGAKPSATSLAPNSPAKIHTMRVWRYEIMATFGYSASTPTRMDATNTMVVMKLENVSPYTNTRSASVQYLREARRVSS